MNGSSTIILRIDIPSDQRDNLLDLFEHGFNRGIVDGYYFLTENQVPVKHNEPHLQYENRLGIAIAALQNEDVLIRSIADSNAPADTDPETGIEYGDLT